jgi:hypothetical protein
MSGQGAAWTGLAAGVGVLGIVVGLFNRVVQPANEIGRYADDVLDAGLAIARNLDGVDELERTRDLGGAVPGLALAYLDRLGRDAS